MKKWIRTAAKSRLLSLSTTVQRARVNDKVAVGLEEYHQLRQLYFMSSLPQQHFILGEESLGTFRPLLSPE